MSQFKPTVFGESLPESSFEEGGYKRVREIHGILADAIRGRFGVHDATPVLMTEYQMYGGMFMPETDDECDLIVTCGEHSRGFADITTDANLTKLARWAVLPV